MQDYLFRASGTHQFIKLKPGKEGTKKGIRQKALTSLTGIKQSHSSPVITAPVDLLATVKNYLINNQVKPEFKNIISKSEVCLLFLIDSSASMIKDKQIVCIKGLIEQTIDQNKYKKIKYAALALYNNDAQLVSAFTVHPQKIVEAIKQLRTGGKTNMKAGFQLVNQLIKVNPYKNKLYRLYIFTDGKINAGDSGDPFHEAVCTYKNLLRSLSGTTVIDTEKGFVKLGMAEKLANGIGSDYQLIMDN